MITRFELSTNSNYFLNSIIRSVVLSQTNTIQQDEIERVHIAVNLCRVSNVFAHCYSRICCVRAYKFCYIGQVNFKPLQIHLLDSISIMCCCVRKIIQHKNAWNEYSIVVHINKTNTRTQAVLCGSIRRHVIHNVEKWSSV